MADSYPAPTDVECPHMKREEVSLGRDYTATIVYLEETREWEVAIPGLWDAPRLATTREIAMSFLERKKTELEQNNPAGEAV